MPVLMSIDSLVGASKIPGYEGWMLLSSFDWGGTRSIPAQSSPTSLRRTIANAPQLRGVTVVRGSDFLSPQIWELMIGTTRKVVKFVWLRTGSDQLEAFMKIELEGALITAMGETANYAEPDESITFTFQAVTITVVNVGDRLTGPQDVAVYNVPQAVRS